MEFKAEIKKTFIRKRSWRRWRSVLKKSVTEW